MSSQKIAGATFSPKIALKRIVIDLPVAGLPVVTLHGGAVTENRRVGRAGTEATVSTMHLPPSGRAFIHEMLAAFSPPAEGASPPTKPRLRVASRD